jgi:hypothetical protein
MRQASHIRLTRAISNHEIEHPKVSGAPRVSYRVVPARTQHAISQPPFDIRRRLRERIAAWASALDFLVS